MACSNTNKSSLEKGRLSAIEYASPEDGNWVPIVGESKGVKKEAVTYY
jgi:hypothetical protein